MQTDGLGGHVLRLLPAVDVALALGMRVVCTPEAAYNGKTEEVRRYIGMGVDVDWKNPDKVSLRHTRENRPLSRGEIANERTDPG